MASGYESVPQIAPPGAPLVVNPADLSPAKRLVVAASPILTVAALVGLGYPPVAALTRWRVSHQPKGSKAPGFTQIIKSVKQKEGVSGLYKGLFVNISVGIVPWITILGGYAVLKVYPKAAPYLITGRLAQFGWHVVTTLVILPFEIATVRSIVTPHTLPLTSPLGNLRLLFSKAERSDPLRTLYTPSRFLVSLLPILIAPLSASLLLPQLLKLGEQEGLLAFLASQIIIAIGVRTPLAVLASRLNAQRSGESYAGIEHRKGEDAATPEGIVQIRSTPYEDLVDCAKTIVREEGWSALWRGWPLEAILAVRNYL